MVLRRSPRAARGGSRRRTAALAAVAVSLVCLGTLSGAHAAPGGGTSGQSTIPPAKGGTDSGVLIEGENTVVKAKMRVVLSDFELRVYANETFSVTNGVLTSRSRGWVIPNPGPHPLFGAFPVTHSKVLGFGAIPITADLYLSQFTQNGVISPLLIDTQTLVNPPFTTKPTIVHGPLVLRIANVKVDEVPLNVGPNCHSIRPIALRLVGKAPAYNLFTGGPLRGKVTIPPFAGCGTNGDDLDPLLTGTISGPGNPVIQHQGNLGAWDPSKPNDCRGCLPPKH